MAELHFQENQYYQICDYAQTGNLDELRSTINSFPDEDKARFSTNTFCPDPTLHLPSPFVVAAQHGHLNVLKYLLETFPGRIDVNRGATVVSKTQHIRTHSVPPLVAACTSGNLEVVKYLVEQGADIHKQSLTKATPLRAAAYYGYIHIMEYLLDLGANINEPNCVGSSPLLAAAHNGGLDACLLLLKRGCNVDERTIEGYTAVHEAAHRGKADVLKILLNFGLPAYFSSAPQPITGEGRGMAGERRYVPSPLFLAASMGHKNVFNMLIDHPDCTLECKAYAYLLFATSMFEYPVATVVPDDPSYECWKKGIELMEELNVSVSGFLHIQEYSNMKGMCFSDANDTLQIWSDPQFANCEKPLLCLMIRERCLGLEDQSLMECLINRGYAFLHTGLHNECEGLWARAMLVEETICQVESSHPKLFGYCYGIMKDLQADVEDFVEGMVIMVLNGYTPNFGHLFQFGLNCLAYLKKKLLGKGDSEVIDLQPIIVSLLKLLYIWMVHDYDESDSFTPTTMYVASCKQLVQLHSSDSNLLFLFLSHILPDDVSMVLPHSNPVVSIALDTLLSCGACRFINETLPHGVTPILCVLNSSWSCSDNTVISQCLAKLIEYGAHPDAVSVEGSTFYSHEMRSSCSAGCNYLLQLVGPRKLSCVAASTIVKEGIDYLESDHLPPHVVSFIKLHDLNCVKCQVVPVTKYFTC